MHYQVSRNGQMYGPYTLEDLQRYLASGNVLPTDLAKTEEMTEWIPVSQILGTTPPAPASPFPTPGYADVPQAGYAQANFAQPAYGAPAPVSAALAASTYPDAPNLHWGLYFLFAFLTCGLFSKVMTCVQAAWLKKVQPNSQALIFYIAAYVLWVINTFRGRASSMQAFTIMQQIQHHQTNFATPATVAGAKALGFLYFILIIVSRFVMRNSLQEHFNTVEPIGLDLNPVLTFFFGGVYFQAEFNRINAMKQAARMGMGRGY